MPPTRDSLRAFADFLGGLKGDEKGEAVLYVDRLMRAFGHEGSVEAGGTHELRIKTPPTDAKAATTKFADFVWPGRVLVEMKRRGENLAKHYQQAFDYWLELVPNRPTYVLLSNFDEIWVYDLNRQLREPLQRIRAARLGEKDNADYKALTFLGPDAALPVFTGDRVKVTKAAAALVAEVYNSLVGTKTDRPSGNVPPEKAQRYVLQCLVALFSEDADLLPEGLFGTLVTEARRTENAYDLVGGLFRQMNDPRPAPAGRYAGVGYFNGGLFATVEPLALNYAEMAGLAKASKDHDWSQVEPEIFGTLFQASMGREARHAYGAHYTSPIDIMKVVVPTIVRPWDRRIAGARTFEELLALKRSLAAYRVLDPACGSGNFLYVAYRELKAVERRLVRRMLDLDPGGPNGGGSATDAALRRIPFVGVRQFYGLDVLPFAVELAKVTLMLAKELAIMHPEGDDPEVTARIAEVERALPLDNLDANLLCADALFTAWPEADAIVGNPPYLGSRFLPKELGYPYARKLAEAYPGVPRMADFVAYFFRRAHESLKPGGRAGLVGTNTIRQNETREASLDYIVREGGVLLEAVSSQVWSGDAAVYVSIVNWAKRLETPTDRPTAGGEGQIGFALPAENPLTEDEIAAPKRLYFQHQEKRDAPLDLVEVPLLAPSLAAGTDVSKAAVLKANAKAKVCFQGPKPGAPGFFVSLDRARELSKDPTSAAQIKPQLNGDDLLTFGTPRRCVIDLNAAQDVLAAKSHRLAFKHLEATVLPFVNGKLEEEENLGGGNREFERRLGRWWRFRRDGSQVLAAIARGGNRYVACSIVTKRPIFEEISCEIMPDSALQVFAFEDDYSFGILQSGLHFAWFRARCSSLKGDYRYTSETVFDSFPWPQAPTEAQIRAVANAAVALRTLRRSLMAEHRLSYRALYRTLETPGKNPLRDAQDALDRAVRRAYAFPDGATNADGAATAPDPLADLLALNLALAAREAAGDPITPPGLPAWIPAPETYVTDDCIRPAD